MSRCPPKGIPHNFAAYRRHPTLTFFRQELLDLRRHDLLAARFLPVQLAIPPVSKAPLLVDQIDAGPHRIAPRVPIRLVVVDHHRKRKLGFLDFLADALGLPLGLSFGCVHADDY